MVLTREICDEIKSSVHSILTKSIQEPTFLKSVADKVASSYKNISKKLQNLETQIATLDNKLMESNVENKSNINKIMDQIQKIKEEKNSFMIRCDIMDQNSRKNNLRIFNVAEEEHENARKKIVELGTGIVIKEDLTALRVDLMSRVIEKTSLKVCGPVKERFTLSITAKYARFRCMDAYLRETEYEQNVVYHYQLSVPQSNVDSLVADFSLNSHKWIVNLHLT
nr:unnamed protein product [Callosobruchus analis]